MYIIIVNGSPRKKGATAKLNRAISEKLWALNPNIQLETIELGETRPKYCDGCLTCYRTGVCHIQDEVDSISQKIARCDALVLACPTYGSTVSGLFKTFIDRGHFLVEQLLHNKPCLAITTYANAQGSKTLSYLNQVVMTSGGYNTNQFAFKLPFNGNPITSSVNKKLDKAVQKLLKHAAHKNRKAKPLFPLIFNFVAFHIVLKPYAMKHQREYKGIIEHWVQQGIINKETLS